MSLDSRVVPFTPGQRWLVEELEYTTPNRHAVRWPIALEGRPDPAALRQALATVVDRHDALRLRLECRDGRWRQRIAPAGGAGEELAPLTRVDLTGRTPEEAAPARAAAIAGAYHAVNRLSGPLLRFLYLERDREEDDELLLVVNHLTTDRFSLFVVGTEVQKLLAQAARGRPARLPATTDTFESWARRVAAYVRSPEAEREGRELWLRLPWDRVRAVPADLPGGTVVDPRSGRPGYGTFASQRVLIAGLTEAETTALLRLTNDGGTDVVDLVVTAFQQATAALTGSPVLYLFLQDNGRQSIFPDASLLRTVGYVASTRRLLVEGTPAGTAPAALPAVRAQLRALPNRGLTLDWLLRPGDGEPVAEELRGIAGFADVAANYHGRIERWWPAADPPEVATIKEHGLRNHPFATHIALVGGRLESRWEYSSSVHHPETAQGFADAFMDALRELIA